MSLPKSKPIHQSHFFNEEMMIPHINTKKLSKFRCDNSRMKSQVNFHVILQRLIFFAYRENPNFQNLSLIQELISQNLPLRKKKIKLSKSTVVSKTLNAFFFMELKNFNSKA